jgi:alpha-tubulin suppressor-like RCC1 family protein
MGRILRTIATLAVVLVAATLAADARAADTISFGDQGATGTFGANATVQIDGSITYDVNCPKPGIDDFFYAATDVYLVPAGSAGGELHDAGGGRPNTIVATTSMFLDEVIAVTEPAGSLSEGVYDVVYDTCQDGRYDPGKDTVFANAVTVELPAVLPLADGPIRKLKDEARAEYEAWLDTRRAMNGIFKLADRALKVQCKAGNAIGCAMKKLDYFGGVKERFLTLLLSQANHYLAIAEDPPNPNYKSLTALAPVDFPRDRSDSALSNSTSDALRPLAGEAAVSAAYLQAVERYQGAQAAGDAEWALIHARQAGNLAETLRRIVPAAGDALAELRSAVADSGELEPGLTRGREFVLRVWNTGLTADERRVLRNQGLTEGQVAELEAELRGYATSSGVDSPGLLAALDESRSAHAATATALADGTTAWAGIVATLEADPDVPDPAPAIDAGGPYAADEGAALELNGSAAGSVGSAAWDLDGDGAFDDANGLDPSVTFAEAGAHVVGLWATAQGREAVSYAVVRVADTNHAPALSSPVPALRSGTVVVGSSLELAISADDPDGDPVAYQWTIDGTAAGSGSSLTFTPTLAQVGDHAVEVTASDGTVGGGSTRRAWDVVVLAEDGDGDGWTKTTDCDDVDAAVHPTADELLGNGLDDDCDPGTPDAPPGGLVGSMQSWGSNHNGTIGDGSNQPTLVHAPVAIPGYDDVVQITEGDRSGYAVLASGEVRAWGYNGAGNLGNGEIGSPRLTPVSPLAVGGAAGTRLTGITQIASSSHGSVVARRVDGSVLTWGDNQSRQGGDGSTVNNRLFPVQVLTAEGGPPLTGVQAVEASTSGNAALMNDGTVRAWGLIHCDGGANVRVEPFPIPLPHIGGDVRQVSSSGYWSLILKKDGTVLSCGAVPPVAGRPVAPSEIYVPQPVTGLGAGSVVIDISAGYEGGLALKADGSVWTWGYNANGSLHVVGVPGGGSAPAPLQVPLPPGPPVVDIEMDGACHALALRADGSLLSWGCDFFGQVGDGEQPGDWIIETPTLVNLGGASAYKLATGTWNSLVMTRPAADPSWERPETWVQASIADATVGEGSGGRFAISLSATLSHDVKVDWSIEAGTADGSDVTLGSGTATVPAGAETVEVDVPVLNDTLDEDAETFTIALRDASNGIRLARSQATGTIADDDEPPSISIQPASVSEGNTSLTDAALSVQLSAPSGKPITVAFGTADGSAGSPADYQASSGKLLFAPGEQQATVHVPVRGDRLAEPSESFTVSLSAPANATLGASSATATITDDEPLTLNVASPRVTEGHGSTQATFTVTLQPAAPAGATVSVDYHLTGITASVPGDVAAASGTLQFGPGEGQKQLTVEVQGDREPEDDELFRLVLENPGAGDGRPVIRGENAIAVIVDDDGNDDQPAVGRVTAVEPSCQDFAAGRAQELAQVLYTLRSNNRIGSLTPWNVRYWTQVVAPAASFTIEVAQSTTHPNFAQLFDLAHAGQVRLHDAGCRELAPASIAVIDGQARVEVAGATPGATYILSVRYGTQPFLGKPAPAPASVHYDFRTKLNGAVVGSDPNGLDLTRRP